MTFERPAWLVLLLLVAVYGLVYWIARRYWSARVTYGELWQRVANMPHAPRALIRRLLTLALSIVMLGCVVLALAKPYIDEPPPPPADIVILLDTSVSTVRQYQDRSTLDALKGNVSAILGKLRKDDRAWLLYTRCGHVVSDGPLPVSNPDALRERLATIEPDFYPLDAGRFPFVVTELLNAVSDGAGRRRDIFIVTGISTSFRALPWPKDVGVHLDAIGAQGEDHAFTRVERGEDRARIHYRGLGRIRARGVLQESLTYPEPGVCDLVWPTGSNEASLELIPFGSDPVLSNNTITLKRSLMPLLEVAVAAADPQSKVLLNALAQLIDGIEANVRFIEPGQPADTQLLIVHGDCDVTLGKEVSAVIALGGLPAELGVLDTSRVKGEVTGTLAAPTWLCGEEMRAPVTALRVDNAIPLADMNGWLPLLETRELGTLIAAKRTPQRNILYVASSLDDGELATAPAVALLVRRIVEETASAPRQPPPLLIETGMPIEIESAKPMFAQLKAPFLNESRTWRVEPVNGKCVFAETYFPGRYRFAADGDSNAVSFDVFWLADEATIPFGPVEPLPLRAWPLPPIPESQWYDDCATLLLIAALALLTLEWALYWFGITD